ncbi:DUF1772 domain-containing protein [Pseudoxanthomonas sp. UTMC 1351]|uniref:DUF1772 domain-containing protein n=1 Tax=Pseudoxanthomonas sp. UTMC 1351 TaxID=2695853 RepID=UPI0034CE06EF
MLLWFNAIGCGLMAGLFFAFSTFIMKASGRIAPAAGIAAMNSINEVILRSLFMPLFWSTTVASAVLAVFAVAVWDEAGAKAVLAGGVVYLIGMFVCTLAIEVPLNNQLKSAADSDSALPMWQRYLARWTQWNHVRTVSCTLSCALFIWALVERG